MKKSTILMLLIVFLGSVLIVGVFGMQAIPFEQVIYVQEIIPTSVHTSNGNQVEFKYRESDKRYYCNLAYEENLTVIISTKITPADSTKKNLKITIVNNKPDDPIAVVGERGEIEFRRRGTVHVRFSAQDSVTAPVMDFWIYCTKKA